MNDNKLKDITVEFECRKYIRYKHMCMCVCVCYTTKLYKNYITSLDSNICLNILKTNILQSLLCF